MASTNKTPNLQLSQFIATDKPAWLTDVNGDMSKIDTAVKSVSDRVGVNETAITEAEANIEDNANNITALQASSSQHGTDITDLKAQDIIIKNDITNLQSATTNLENKFIPTSEITIRYGSNSYVVYSKVGRIVYVNVYYRVSDGSIASWSSKVIATLPAGYRPYGTEIAYAYGCTDGVQGVWCEISPNGEVKISTRGNAFESSSERVRASLTFISES